MDDAEFLADITERLAGLPGVVAVSLGGSRATGAAGPDSDWDLAIYYRDQLDPADLRAIGWEGQVFEVGSWGGGVFNGGAWLHIDGRKVDVHYRDLTVVQREIDESAAGRFRVEPLLFHLAGIPSYIVVAELALGRVLHGSLPSPRYPAALRERAPEVWWASADLLMDYAASSPALRSAITQCAGLLAQAAMQTGHAVLAARGEWVTNERRLLRRAGLGEVDAILAGIGQTPEALACAVRAVREVGSRALFDATQGRLPGTAG